MLMENPNGPGGRCQRIGGNKTARREESIKLLQSNAKPGVTALEKTVVTHVVVKRKGAHRALAIFIRAKAIFNRPGNPPTN
jgi:hypothetical protein